jgi:hypothetical protein
VLQAAEELHPAHALVSIKALAFAVSVLSAFLIVWWYWSGQSDVSQALQGPWNTAMILPGHLASAHFALIRSDNCVACHIHSGPVTEAACLTCHQEIAKAQSSRIGYHAKLTGACVACHTEHHGANADLRNFDRSSFNHDLASFKLNGAHRATACDQCHLQHSPTRGEMHYIGLAFSTCDKCHSNPHVDMPAADCARCHTEQSWRGRDIIFVHNRDSQFKLDAVHRGVSCNSCHKQTGTTAIYRGTPTSCVQCHGQITSAMGGRIGSLIVKPDPHAGRVSCVECHNPGVASPTPQQYAAACVRCHSESYRGLFFDWQKSLDEREQAARKRLSAQTRTDPGSERLLNQIHAAGMHNLQGSIDSFETLAR